MIRRKELQEYNTLAELKAEINVFASENDLVRVKELQRLYNWDGDSFAIPDDVQVIKPDNILLANAGRWVLANLSEFTNATLAQIEAGADSGKVITAQSLRLVSRISNTSGTTAFGVSAGSGVAGQTAIGKGAGAGATQINTTYIGHQAGVNSTGNRSFFGGFSAGNTSTGVSGTGIGYSAASLNSGARVVAIGDGALGTNSGDDVYGIGRQALLNNTADDVFGVGDQVAIGNGKANAIIVRNNHIKKYANRAAAFADFTIANGCIDTNSYLFYNQETNAVEVARFEAGVLVQPIEIDETTLPSAELVGRTRYYTDATNSYFEVCMQTGPALYEWVLLSQQTII